MSALVDRAVSGAPRRRPARSRARRRSGAVALGLTVVLLAATASGAAAATSGHAAGETDGETTATTVDPSLAKGTVPFILCKTPVAESVEPSDDVELLVENLISQAGKLKGKLLLIHGLQDPVVVQQHSVNFVKACVEKGVQVDYMIYPGHEHNVLGKDRVHLYQKVTDYLVQYLQ